MEEACRLDVFCIGTADFYNRYGRELCRWFRNNLDTVETQKSGKYKKYLRKTTWKVSWRLKTIGENIPEKKDQHQILKYLCEEFEIYLRSRGTLKYFWVQGWIIQSVFLTVALIVDCVRWNAARLWKTGKLGFDQISNGSLSLNS